MFRRLRGCSFALVAEFSMHKQKRRGYQTYFDSKFENYFRYGRGRITKYKIRAQITVAIPTTVSSIGSLTKSAIIPPRKSLYD
jgi:hypothetical protein